MRLVICDAISWSLWRHCNNRRPNSVYWAQRIPDWRQYTMVTYFDSSWRRWQRPPRSHTEHGTGTQPQSLATNSPAPTTPPLDCFPACMLPSSDLVDIPGKTSTGPLSDLQYRQVRLDWWSTLRMRARQAPLPPTAADCHLDYFPACMPPRPTEYRWHCGSEMGWHWSARWLPASGRYQPNFDPLCHVHKKHTTMIWQNGFMIT